MYPIIQDKSALASILKKDVSELDKVDEKKDDKPTEEKPTEETKAKEDEEHSDMNDDTDMPMVTAAQFKDMMHEVWKEGYQAGDESDEPDNEKSKKMGMPADDCKMKDMKVGQCKALMDDCMGDMRPSESKAEDQKEVKIMIDGHLVLRSLPDIIKAGRVLSSKNETRLRQAVELLGQVLEQLDKNEQEEETQNEPVKETENEVEKKVIPYKDLGIAPESEAWDGPGEISKASVEDLKLMCGWYDDEKAEDKSSYKLPHHHAEGHKAVWRGVAAAMGALLGARGGTDIPEADRKGIYNHLSKHYKEFGKEPPEFKMVEDQVLAGLSDEIDSIALGLADKHIIKLINKVLENQKEKKKPTEVKQDITVTNEQAIKALEVLNKALSKV